MNNKELAQKILELSGGEKNITYVTHCATRLRLVVKSEAEVNLKAIDSLEGVLKAQHSGGQLQVVIGAKVNKIYDEFTKLGSFTNNNESDMPKVKKNPVNAFIETISGIFTPILPALVGCGMMKCLSSLMTSTGMVDPSTGFITVFNMIADCVFYFMPFFLAVSAARKFKTNEYLAIALAGCLLHPTILDAAGKIAETGIDKIDFLGLPILLVKYTSTVIPIILSVWLLSYVYKFVEKIVPDLLKVLLVPMITLLIMVPVQLIAIGPFGSYVGTWIAEGLNILFAKSGIVAGALLGFFRPILVMFGMHYSIMPMQIQQVAETGVTVLTASALAANLAQAGAAFGVFLKTRNKTMKAAAGSSSLTALFGITEPAIYGVTLRYKKPFFAGCLAAGLVSGFFGLVNANANAIALPGILSLSTYNADRYIYIIIGVVAAFVLGCVFTLIAGVDDFVMGEDKKVEAKEETVVSNEGIIVKSPVEGTVKDLAEVNDNVFAEGLMGKGIAIEPKVGKVVAPFDGIVEAIFKTNHAIGLKSKDGAEVLIHIGLDTVNLEGNHFKSHIEKGQAIKAGDLLVEFDIDAIKKEGYDVITPVIITNSDNFKDVMAVKNGEVTNKDDLLNLI
ncbi:beta-glucoside-specific PTS transporter subunit IIABC [Clostridium paraputrificum]|uniref:PTS beta-glucoside transporter subunit EIIBCA n=4 Tax=Clostridium TaxID=1485 RepID=A0A174D1Q2_9CLOT|nr:MULTISPECIES: beta-glucoside-specific PTS transporter subunit IIABC [Clostridium]MDB2089478.1 beta-glucoside-specific PTS transporter subunit IIABC [Clostridium paraputrificum]MDB2096414.1 beta-glucoside-specific PTS transporter subunit IIABC [Clostridium paraputrificum]MDB2103632.1 beta-glucoside-specific PTS transporter subunit IIABC [Clostridium paraputrificum]MDB2123376.1 beta-glucoside-specific PTS transporter subunit IIABC [Clostridium paraputrificum]MDU1179916.1 beta-glucoside-specif